MDILGVGLHVEQGSKNREPTEKLITEGRLEGAKRGPVSIWGREFHAEETTGAKVLSLDPSLIEGQQEGGGVAEGGNEEGLETSKRGRSKEVKRSPEDHCKTFFMFELYKMMIRYTYTQ